MLHYKQLVGLSRQRISTTEKLLKKIVFNFSNTLFDQKSVVHAAPGPGQCNGTHTHADRRTLQLIYWIGPILWWYNFCDWFELSQADHYLPRMIFRALPERLSEAEIDEMLTAADTDGKLPIIRTNVTFYYLKNSLFLERWETEYFLRKKIEKMVVFLRFFGGIFLKFFSCTHWDFSISNQKKM